jgi:outer membrane protein assembly factor BamB
MCALVTDRNWNAFARQPAVFATALLLILAWDRYCLGQGRVIVGPGRGGIIVNQGATAIDLPSDRTMARGIDRAKDRIADGEYSQALRFLDEVLAGSQDSFVPVGDTGEHIGLKETASAMIRDLPPEGRELYQSTYGPAARKKLNEALASGDMTALREIVWQYFYTPAGYEAAMQVAQLEADAGRHLSASLLFDELLRIDTAAERFNPQLTLLAAKSRLALGDVEKTSGLLSSLNALRASHVKIAGREELLTSVANDPLGWYERVIGKPATSRVSSVDEWLTSRGDTTRNGHALGGLPHVRVRWEARLLSHPQFETVYDEFWTALQQRNQPLPAAGVPLAIGDTVIATTAQNVIAVDFRTGKRVWQTQPQRIAEFEQLLSFSGDSVSFDTNIQSAQSFARRLWDDYLYNSVSSDGERVFVIRDLRLPDFEQPDPWAMPFGMRTGADTPGAVNRLCAYDLSTQGKLVWELDGAAIGTEVSGAYFLGAPVVVDEKLYCLAEIKSAIHLVAIDHRTGELAGLQQLAGLQNGIYLDPLRRSQAAVPSYDSGMLVCPTGAGVVIGINLERNALAWAYQYETSRNISALLRRENSRSIEQPGHWIEGSAILADGCVILAPPESNFLHCLDLLTGKLRWKRERGDGIYLAGVDHGRLLVIGLRGVTALELEGGKPAWPQESLSLPNDAAPSGRGFFTDGKYYLPLSNAEIVAIDTKRGEIVERTRSRSGTVLGNLIAHKGAILSQNGKFLDCFDQIEVLRESTESRLAKDPDDVEALRTLGELAYNDGKLSRAIELLERAYALSSAEPRTREVLSECLLEALKQDFAAYYDRLPKLREIMQDSSARMLDLLRIEAQGLLELDRPWESFEACVHFYETANDKQALLPIDANYQATAASWLRAQTAAIWRQANSDNRQRIADRLTSMFVKLLAGSEESEAFLESFGDVGDFALEAKLSRAERLAAGNQPLAAQQAYFNFAEQPGPAHAEALAVSSKLLHDRGYDRLAVELDAELAGPLAETPCLAGKTGRQCLEEWQVSPPKNTLDWPYGKVIIDEPTQPSQTGSQSMRVPLSEIRLEQCDGVLGRCNVFFLGRGVGDLLIRDSYGREVFRQNLRDEERQFGEAAGVYGVARGNLLIISMGRQIAAIDTLSRGTDTKNVLWRKGTMRSASSFSYTGTRPPLGGDRPGSYRPLRSQADGAGGRWLGILGPLTEDSFVYQDQRGLCCVDSLTGRLRWSRTDTPNACHLFGDERVVIAVEQGSAKAHTYSTQDGRSLGEVEIPRWQEQLATRGTDVIAWRRLPNGQFELSAYDAVVGSVAWQHLFERQSQVDVAMNRYVAVVEPSGRYVLIDAKDGRVIADHRASPLLALSSVHMFAGTDQFVVAAGSTGHRRFHLSQLDFAGFDGQLLAFEAKTGKPLWSRPAEVRDHALMLNQPVDAPAITFIGTHSTQNANGSGTLISMLLLEKSSGRVLLTEDNLPPSPNHFAVICSADSNEVLVEMVNRLVRMKFTDAPRSPEPPATYEVSPGEQEGPKGLFGIFEKVLDRGK